MININKNTKDEFEASNGLVGFKFFKTGKNQGKYELNFKSPEGKACNLKGCYASINFHPSRGFHLVEVTSKIFSFESQIEKVEDKIDKGLVIEFNPTKSEENLITFKIQFKIYEKKDFLFIKLLDITDQSPEFLSVHSISPLTTRNELLFLSGGSKFTQLDKISWFKNGFQSWSPCRVLFGKQKDRMGPPTTMFKRVLDNQDYAIKGRFYSEYCTVITDIQSQNSLILGFTTLKKQFSRIVMDFRNNQKLRLLTAFGCMDGVKFSESLINSSEELLISFKTNNIAYKGLIDYAKVVKANVEDARQTKVPVGWCSWYYYFKEVTQNDILNNLEFFKLNKQNLPIDFIQLDDGYYSITNGKLSIGDYNISNDKFPQGLSPLFENIRSLGYKGGIWTAPFFAVKKSELFKKHSDWFLNKIGKRKFLKAHFNWGAFLYSLDLTNEEVIDYLTDFFSNLLFAFKKERTIEENHLIEFFKIDFLHAGVPIDGDYKDKTLTRAELYYNGVKAIRDAITDKNFLLGCGAPLGPCVGLVDAMRIGMDTAPQWEILGKIGNKLGFTLPSLKAALLNTIYRSFMHKYFWINDPDCLMVRRSNTKLTQDEINAQITIFGLSGGQLLISDDMSKLSADEINDAKLTIPPYNPEGFDPIPIDAFTSKLPYIYALETHEKIGKRYLISVLNWDDIPISKSLQLSRMVHNLGIDVKTFYVFDFWNRKFLGSYENAAELQLNDIAPHSCRYLSTIPIPVDKKEQPILLSSTLHISQGCCEIKKFDFIPSENKISIDIELLGKRKGSIYFKLPAGKKISNSNLKSSNLDSKENIWEISIEFENQISLEIKLS